MEIKQYHSDKIVGNIQIKENILDDDLRENYRIVMNKTRRMSTPFMRPGGFCLAFKMTNGSDNVCFRVWFKVISDAVDRYRIINDHLRRVKLEYFSGFRFVQQALRNDGVVLPGMKMDWIEGDCLHEFLKKTWSGMSKIDQLNFIKGFYRMCYDLRVSGIAHGDLSCKNILVTPLHRLRLVDYDTMWVSAMGSEYYHTTLGIGAFQHPQRMMSKSKPLKSSAEDDNFSQLVIALSLWVAYFNPSVGTDVEGDSLLFDSEDLSGLTPLRQSMGWKAAQALRSKFAHIGRLIDDIEAALTKGMSSTRPLTYYATRDVVTSSDFYSMVEKAGVPEPPKPQKVNYVMAYCTACGRKFDGTGQGKQYCTACGTKRFGYTVVK